ncbi:MAG: hypothetical protein ACOC2W_03920, partial [bacterium]
MFLKYCNDIQNSKNLRQCEKIFLDLINDIYVLGQIYLTEKDVLHIGNLLRKKIEILKNNDSFLLKEAPITTSLYLLHLGRKEYQEGNFWDSIYNQLNIHNRNYKWNSILG